MSSGASQPPHDFPLPPDLPAPFDDGACAHLAGLRLPSVRLASTSGGDIDLASLSGWTIVFCYPMTGVPGVPLPDGWDLIAGARGCTPQTCGFRDLHQEFVALGARVFGLSAQTSAYQREMVERLHVPFAILSDAEFRLTEALRLPTFSIDDMRLIRRLTLVLREGAIARVLYPVFPPDRSAADALARLRDELRRSSDL